MNNNDRTRGTIINVLDHDKLKKLTFDLTGNEDIVPQRLALVVDPDGKLYTLCTEGVGWGANTDNELMVPCFAGMSWCDFEFAADDIVKCLGDETEDLSEFIRTFGARLDSNFYQWQGRINKAPQTISA